MVRNINIQNTTAGEWNTVKITGKRQTASVLSGAEPEFADLKQRVIRASESFARYRRTALPDRTAKSQNRTVGKYEISKPFVKEIIIR